MPRLAHKAAFITFANAFSQIIAILTTIFMVRMVDKDFYGSYSQLILISTTLCYVLGGGIPASLLYFFPKLSVGEKRSLNFQTLFILMGLGLIGLILAVSFARLISNIFSNPVLFKLLIIFSVYIFFNISSRHLSTIYYALDRIRTGALMTVLIQTGLSLTIILSLTFDFNLKGLVLAIVCWGGLLFAVTVFVTLFLFNSEKAIKGKQLFIRQLGYSLPIGASGLIWFIGKEIDKYFISGFFLPSVFAVYTIGARSIPFLESLTVSINIVLIPKMSELIEQKQFNEISRLWAEMMRKLSMIYFPITIFLLFAAYPLIVFLFTENYSGACIVFMIYLLLIPIRIIDPTLILKSLGKTKLILTGTVLFVVMNLILNYISLAVLKMGIIGPAIATVIAVYIMVFFLFVHILRQYQINFKDVRIGKNLIFTGLISFISGLMAYFCALFFVSLILQLLIMGSLFVLFYFVLMIRFGLMTQDDRTLLISFIKGKIF